MRYWALTDPGVAREENQDTYKIESLNRHTLLCVICDGMGGAKSGNVASTLAADVFTQEVKKAWTADMSTEKTEQMLEAAVKLANFTVFDQSRQSEEFQGMGTTMVALLIQGKHATVVNVGDSRAYRISDAGIKQITKDHSLVQMMIARGELSKERAKHYPGKNLITRAIGTEEQVSCDIFHTDACRGDYFLLCTDGLSNMVDDQEILFEVAHGQGDAQCCERLLEIAKNRGAPDNVTSVLVRV